MKSSVLVTAVLASSLLTTNSDQPSAMPAVVGDGGYGYVVVRGSVEGQATAYFSSVFSYCSTYFPMAAARSQALDELEVIVDFDSSLAGGPSAYPHGPYEDRGEALNERRKAMADAKTSGGLGGVARVEVRTFSFTFYDENC